MVFGRGRSDICVATREKLSAHLDGRLSPAEAGVIEEHLLRCKGCAAELEGLRNTVNALRQLPNAPLPRSFLLTAPPARQPKLYFYLRNASAAIATVFVALLAFSVVLQGTQPGLVALRSSRESAAPASFAAPATTAQYAAPTAAQRAAAATNASSATAARAAAAATTAAPAATAPGLQAAPRPAAAPAAVDASDSLEKSPAPAAPEASDRAGSAKAGGNQVAPGAPSAASTPLAAPTEAGSAAPIAPVTNELTGGAAQSRVERTALPTPSQDLLSPVQILSWLTYPVGGLLLLLLAATLVARRRSM